LFGQGTRGIFDLLPQLLVTDVLAREMQGCFVGPELRMPANAVSKRHDPKRLAETLL
jgi:hypothetical protein